MLIFLVIGIIGIFAVVYQKQKKSPDAIVELNASVAFDGNRIYVTNNDTIDYLNAEMTVNGYYKLTGMNLRAGETYILWPVEFAHVNGRRLPARQKPQQFSIWCGLKEGGNGFYSVKFKTAAGS